MPLRGQKCTFWNCFHCDYDGISGLLTGLFHFLRPSPIWLRCRYWVKFHFRFALWRHLGINCKPTCVSEFAFVQRGKPRSQTVSTVSRRWIENSPWKLWARCVTSKSPPCNSKDPLVCWEAVLSQHHRPCSPLGSSSLLSWIVMIAGRTNVFIF